MVFKTSVFVLIFFSIPFLVFPADSTPVMSADNEELVSWWTFEKSDTSEVQDKVTGIQDSIEGNFRFVVGSSGEGIKFDGFLIGLNGRFNLAFLEMQVAQVKMGYGILWPLH